jgi:Secretion system C-terminal sorting domain/Domain of unknown function DUF11/CARDB
MLLHTTHRTATKAILSFLLANLCFCIATFAQALTITNITGTTTAKPSEQITLNVTVKNEGIAPSPSGSTLHYIQENKAYQVRPVSYDKLVLPTLAGNETKTFAYTLKLRDTLLPPNANFVSSSYDINNYAFGDYYVALTNGASPLSYGCFGNYEPCTSKKYNITPIYPKANVTVGATVSKNTLVLDEKFSATYTITNKGGSTVPNMFVNLGSFTNEGRNYSPTSYSVSPDASVADPNTKLIWSFGESMPFGWEIFNLKVGETRKATLQFSAPFKEQYASYGAYNPTPLSNSVAVYYPTINKGSSFENTAPTATEQPPFKVVLDMSNLADIELSNLIIANPTVQENGILNFKFDLKNLGNKAVTQNFAINSYLYKDKEGIDRIALQDGVINTGNIGAKATVIGVMGALTAKVPSGQYYLRIDAFQFSTPLAELLKSNNVLVSTIPITVIGNTNICKGDLSLDTQAKVNAFNHTCTTWDGNIDIAGSVTDLTPLSNLNIVTGRFVIGGANHLTNVQGLNNLQKTGIFVLNGNANITSLAALSKLNSVSTTFILSTMPKLTELGLQTLTLNTVTHAEVFDLPNLKNTGNFLLKTPYLTEILVKGGMTNIDFLKGIPSFGLLQLTECPNLLNVNGLSQTTTFNNLIIATHKSLTNLDGLAQTTKVNQTLTIADNPALQSCCGVVNILKNSTPTTLNILNNLSGCNSKADILATCSKPAKIPDLTLANFTLTQTSVEKGNVLNYKFDLKNIGTANATTNFFVKSYLSKDNILSADDVQDGTINTGNINAGAMVAQVMGALTANIAAGQYYVILKVDADNQVVESNENNNTSVAAHSIEVKATATTTSKLTILSVKADKPIPIPTNSFTVDVTFKNEGTTASALTTVSIQSIVTLTSYGKFCSGVEEHYEPITNDVALPALAAGETKTIPINFKVIGYNLSSLGLVILKENQKTTPNASTDPLCASLQYTMVSRVGIPYKYVATTPTTPLPDLTLTNLLVGNTNVKKGTPLSYTIDVKNIGNLPAGKFIVRPYLFKGAGFGVEEGGRALEGEAVQVNSLGIGQMLKIAGSISTGTLAVGNYTLSFQANGDYAIKESDFSNNQFKATQGILLTNGTEPASAALQLTINLTDVAVKQWNWSEFEVTVKNNGTAAVSNMEVKIPLPSPDFVYAYERFVPANPVFNTHTGIWNVGNLAVGVSKTLKVAMYALKNNAPYKSEVTVVGTNIMKMITFNKNVITPNSTTPDIAISITTSPNSYTQYSNLAYKITVTNNGQQTIGGVKTDLNYIESGKLPFVSAKTSIGNYNGYTKIWEIGTLNGGQSVTMDLVLYPLVKGEDLEMKVTVVPTDAIPQNNIATLILKNAVNTRNEPNTIAGFGIQNIYPNPAEDRINIDLKNETDGELYITIFDTFGRMVQKAVQHVSKNNPSIQVEIAELPEGMYILQLSDATHRTFIRKFVK